MPLGIYIKMAADLVHFDVEKDMMVTRSKTRFFSFSQTQFIKKVNFINTTSIQHPSRSSIITAEIDVLHFSLSYLRHIKSLFIPMKNNCRSLLTHESQQFGNYPHCAKHWLQKDEGREQGRGQRVWLPTRGRGLWDKRKGRRGKRGVAMVSSRPMRK